jgi:hypothetical protein
MLNDTGDRVGTMVFGHCVVLCEQAGWFVGGGNECKFCGSCQIRVTSMHYIKSIRMFEDDVT